MILSFEGESILTINVALVTNDSIVFGCDSVASRRDALVDPFALEFVKD